MPAAEDDDEVAKLWARERLARSARRTEGDAGPSQPVPRKSQAEAGLGAGFFGAAQSAEECEADMAAKVSAFLNLYREVYQPLHPPPMTLTRLRLDC